MAKISKHWKAAIAVSTLILAVGCSTASSAPFHMYSSPLLEGEMNPPRSTGDGDGQQMSPGVEPRQVYVYQKWHPDGVGASTQPSMPTTTNGDTPPPTPDTAVYATYDSAASTDGHSTGTDAEDLAETESIPTPSDDFDLAEVAAQFIHTTLSINDIEFGDAAAESIAVLYRECRSQGETFDARRPAIGDLIFFHNTYDANKDGRNNDWYTLVGIVEDIRPDGTVQFLAYRGNGIETLHFNRQHSDRRRDAQHRPLNSKLRAKTSDDPAYTQYLAGQLFAGYCNILGDRKELILMDEWSPTMNL